MISIENKVKKAILNKKLNVTCLGERNWYSYFVRITELFGDRNNYDGYKVEVYNEKYGDHLATIVI